MREATALEVAVGLLHLPSRVRALRTGDLPPDLEILLRIVAGESLKSADVSEQTAMAAASFYIEQVLMHPDADSYQVLGVNPDAEADLLRRHMALLLRWLHPDRDTDGARTAFVGRVTEAWNNLKTAERRAAYDAARSSAGAASSPGSPARSTAVAPFRGPVQAVNGRQRRPGVATSRRRSTSLSVWHFLRHLIGQYR